MHLGYSMIAASVTPTALAFEQGYAAYWARVDWRANPYPSGTAECRFWDDGWSQGQLDDGESTAEE
jgi:hypothetical protein